MNNINVVKMVKKFQSSMGLEEWISRPLKAKLYEFGKVNWHRNETQLTGRPL